jgi:hypothetical protein
MGGVQPATVNGMRGRLKGGSNESRYHHPHHKLYLSISTYIYLSHQGGGDYRGIRVLRY